MTRWVPVGAFALAVGSNPTRCEPLLDDTSDSRRVHCRRYDNCLVFAIAEGWESFSCDGCSVDEIISKDEWTRDLEGLAALIRAIIG